MLTIPVNLTADQLHKLIRDSARQIVEDPYLSDYFLRCLDTLNYLAAVYKLHKSKEKIK